MCPSFIAMKINEENIGARRLYGQRQWDPGPILSYEYKGYG